MQRLTILKFIFLAICSPSLCLIIPDDYNLPKNSPLCSVTAGNVTLDCELKNKDVTNCCTEDQEEQKSSLQHSYQLVNDTAITFNSSLESTGVHMFYLSKGCNLSSSYCLAILINVPIDLGARTSNASVQISNLPDLYKKNTQQNLLIRKTNVLLTDWDNKSFQDVQTECNALYNTSMNQHVRSGVVALVARPSPELRDQLTAELIKYSCNISCLSKEPQDCEGEAVQATDWPHINESLLIYPLDHGFFYYIIVRHKNHLNCAITLRSFEYRVPEELPLFEGSRRNMIAFIFLGGMCTVFVALGVTGAALMISTFRISRAIAANRALSLELGIELDSRQNSQTINTIESSTHFSGSPSELRLRSPSDSPPSQILLLYSRDSLDLCKCMKALAKVLEMSTEAEVVDPLNDLWGVHTEKHRDAGLSHWLYTVLRSNCSVLLLMTPGGKIREEAMEKLETVVFDPPNMLDDIFLLGINYIKTQMASDYASVFQISYEDIGNTGETYSIAVPNAKYILPLRLQELICILRRNNPALGQHDLNDLTNHDYGCDKYTRKVMQFLSLLEDLKVLFSNDPQYTDRTIVRTTDVCPEKG